MLGYVGPFGDCNVGNRGRSCQRATELRIAFGSVYVAGGVRQVTPFQYITLCTTRVIACILFC